MAISTVAGAYQFLPPVIRPDPNATSASTPDNPRTSTAETVTGAGVAPAAEVPRLDSTAAHTTTGKHLLRLTV